MILENKIQCNKCKDVLVSEYRHDFKFCSCGSCAVDGGKDYAKRLGCDFTDLSVYSDDLEFEEIRELFTWGTRGVNGNKPIKYVALKDLDTDHIKAILNTQWHIKGTLTEEFMQKELAYRGELL